MRKISIMTPFVLAAGCSTPYVGVEIPRLSRHTDVALVAPDQIDKDFRELGELCSRKQISLEKARAAALDHQASIKTVLGTITGGIGILGGGGAALSSQADSKTGATTAGLLTLGFSLVGTIVTAVVTPGQNEMQQSEDSLKSIATGTAALQAFVTAHPQIDQWTQGDSAQYALLVGTLRGTCQ